MCSNIIRCTTCNKLSGDLKCVKFSLVIRERSPSTITSPTTTPHFKEFLKYSYLLCNFPLNCSINFLGGWAVLKLARCSTRRVTIWKLGRTVCIYPMVQRREKEKDSRYIQEASAPAAAPCIRPVTSCTSVT